MVERTGQLLAFGAAGQVGTAVSCSPGGSFSGHLVGLAVIPDQQGYWLVTNTGVVEAGGTAQCEGDVYSDGFTGLSGSRPLAAPIVGIAADQSGGGYGLVGADGGVFPFGDATFIGNTYTDGFTGLGIGNSPLPSPIIGLGAVYASEQMATSANWSGVVAYGYRISGVSGSFKVPHSGSGTAPSQSAVAEWVGIDGWDDQTVIQAGVVENPDSSSGSCAFSIETWWETYPDPPDPFLMSSSSGAPAISCGDTVSVSIQHLAGSSWLITIQDSTAQWFAQQTVSYSGYATSAEWIVEAPTIQGTGNLESLAPFAGSVQFSALAASGSFVGWIPLAMVQGANKVAVPSIALAGTDLPPAFSVSEPASG
jgi:hypothetical protein